jgi:MHS family proline/betaine transporter-like MFS transporter
MPAKIITRDIRKYATLAGNVLEIYNFALFTFLLPTISVQLFPAHSTIAAFTFSYIILSLGSWARLLGAILFGYLGDYCSREKALIISVLMMSFASIGIGLLPSATIIGIYAPIFLGVLRMLQGLSAGGEYSGAGLLLTENKKETAFWGSAILLASGLGGSFLASLMVAIISLEWFPTTSWRVLFLLGGIGLFVLGLYLTLYKPQTNKSKLHFPLPWSTLYTRYKFSFFCTISFSAMGAFLSFINGFMNTYLIATDKYAKTPLMFLNAFLVLICVGVNILCGALTKRFNPLKLMLCANLGIVFFIGIFFLLVSRQSFLPFVLAELILSILTGLFLAPSFAVKAQLFPYEIRYRGVALGTCIGSAIAWTTPYVSARLIQYTGFSWAPVFFLSAISILGLVTMVLVITKSKSLSDSFHEL